jgi:hypothetical protein
MVRFFCLIAILLVFSAKTNAQDEFQCAEGRMKDYILDGQPYKLVLKGSDRGKIYFSFFDAFSYRIAICSNTHKKYTIALYDIQKKVLFSGTCEDYSKVLDMHFKSNIAGYIEIVCNDLSASDPTFQIMIGFKMLKDQQNYSKKE